MAAPFVNPNSTLVKIIFEEAFGISDPAARRAYLDKACGGDQAVRMEAESLLSAHERAGSFLNPPANVASPFLALEGLGGCRFGDYELLEEIGRGGMGVVYKARQRSLNRVVALKTILSGRLATPAAVKRFRSEAQAAAGLNHPNIVSIYEFGECQGHHFYTMPFLEARSLTQLVESGLWRRKDGAEAARLVAKVARAVQHAHEAGVLHRDLKPGNILVDASGEPRVADFGLAKRVASDEHLTLTGDLLGTPGFMAPEQARGTSGQTTPATDVYSLGAVLYYLLTGRAPFVADSPLDALLLVLEGEAVLPRRINPQAAEPLERICLRCLQKRPENRYTSASALAEDLERYEKGEPLAVSHQAVGRRFEAWAKRRPALAARFCFVLLCLGIVMVGWHFRTMDYQTREQHREVILVLIGWLAGSFACQRGLESERHARWVRVVWSCVDPMALTAILLIADAFRSPLVILYPALIAASGFWLRVSLVATTYVASLSGYILLLLNSVRFDRPPLPWHWHVLAIVALSVTAVSVAYLVNRFTALTRFYEHRQPARS